MENFKEGSRRVSEKNRLNESLSPDEWFHALGPNLDEISHRVLRGFTPDVIPWARNIGDELGRCRSFMELGSGTAEISCYLAKNSRSVESVCLVDHSDLALDFAHSLFSRFGMDGILRTFNVDVTSGMGMVPDGDVGCVWSSGLLEHFSRMEQHAILHECWRMSRRKTVHLVPNAMSFLYRLGKWHQERVGMWKWGVETPVYPYELRELITSHFACCQVYSVAHGHAARFLNHIPYMRDFVSDFNSYMVAEKFPDQGYLLVGVGTK